MTNYTAEDVDRAQLTYMAKHGCSPEEADKAVSKMVLLLRAGEKIRTSFLRCNALS